MDIEILSFYAKDILINIGMLILIFSKWSDDNKVYKFGRAIVAMIIIIFITIPDARDAKRAITRDYIQFTGWAQASSSEKIARDRIKFYNEETQETIKVLIANAKISKGDKVTVEYLPCTKYAKVVSIVKETSNDGGD